jgi:Mn2+/Fe2+ NRAMP family transporter
MLLLVNKKELMGEFVNSRIYNVLSWITVAVLILLSLVYTWAFLVNTKS